MQKLVYALFLILAIGLIVVGLSDRDQQPPAVADEIAQAAATEPLTAVTDQVPDYLLDSRLLGKSFTGDLDGMVKRRAIRALVVHSKTFYFFDGAQQKGLSYDALKQFESFLNRKLKSGTLGVNIVFIPVRRDELLPALLDGRGDIAVANLTITPQRRERVDFSKPLMSDVKELLVTGPAAKAPLPGSTHDLAGREVHVRQSSSYYNSLLQLNTELQAQELPELRITTVAENLEDEDLLIDGQCRPHLIGDRRFSQSAVLGTDSSRD